MAEGGKVKEHYKSELIFGEVVTKFQELSCLLYYFDHLFQEKDSLQKAKEVFVDKYFHTSVLG